MRYKKCGDTYLVRIDRNEEIVQSLKTLCGKEDIRLAQVNAIGAVSHAVLGVFDLQEQAYLKEELEGIMEITCLTGNVTRMDGQVYLHLHATLADQNHMVHGGHVFELTVGVTSEIFVRVLPGEAGRAKDQDLGINLIVL